MGHARQLKVRLTIKFRQAASYLLGASLGCGITSILVRGNGRDLTSFFFSHFEPRMVDRDSAFLKASVTADRRDGAEC